MEVNQPAMGTYPMELIHKVAFHGNDPGMNSKSTEKGLADQDTDMEVLTDWTRVMKLGATEEPKLIYKGQPAMETDPKKLVQRDASEGGDPGRNPKEMIDGDASAGVGSVVDTHDEGLVGNITRFEGKITLHEEEASFAGGGQISRKTYEKEKDWEEEEEESFAGYRRRWERLMGLGRSFQDSSE
jgi:hypothetical protein